MAIRAGPLPLLSQVHAFLAIFKSTYHPPITPQMPASLPCCLLSKAPITRCQTVAFTHSLLMSLSNGAISYEAECKLHEGRGFCLIHSCVPSAWSSLLHSKFSVTRSQTNEQGWVLSTVLFLLQSCRGLSMAVGQGAMIGAVFMLQLFCPLNCSRFCLVASFFLLGHTHSWESWVSHVQ